MVLSPARADLRAPARTRLRALAVLTVLVLSACATGPMKPVPPVDPAAVATAATPTTPTPALAPPPPEAPPAPETLARDPTQGLLRFHERMRELPASEVAREITRLDARLEPRLPTNPANPANPASPPGAVAAALPASGAASTPPAGRDPVSADPQLSLELALLLALQRQNGDLARALSLVEPLQRAGAPAATQPLARLLYSRLAEQRRLEEQLERQAQTVRELQRRADQLAAQLEALRAIERSLNTRPSMPVTPGMPGVSGSPGGGAPTPAPR